MKIHAISKIQGTPLHSCKIGDFDTENSYRWLWKTLRKPPVTCTSFGIFLHPIRGGHHTWENQPMTEKGIRNVSESIFRVKFYIYKIKEKFYTKISYSNFWILQNHRTWEKYWLNSICLKKRQSLLSSIRHFNQHLIRVFDFLASWLAIVL